jgi:photosystem II stability/assembly factor-like uncharacterized protein
MSRIAMKIFNYTFVILLSSSLLMFFNTKSKVKTVRVAGFGKEMKRERESRGPYEDFMLQRTYPSKTFDILAYKSALEKAASARSAKNFRSSSTPLQWTLEGPGNVGGRFNCIAVNPLNHDVMYAGSANGGVWKTNDNAINWFPVFDSIPYLAIGAITINPGDTAEIWVGTGDVNISGTMYTGNGLYKSSNSGQTWTYVALANTYVVSAIVFNPANTNEMLVSTMGNPFLKDNNRGIYRSTNGGAVFSNVQYLNDSTGCIDLVQDPVHPDILYATSFTRIRTDELSLYTGTENYIFKSVDFGQTWSQLSGGLPNGLTHERIGVAVAKSNPDVLYAFYSASDGNMPEMYKSTDAGSSWSPVSLANFQLSLYGNQGWYFGKIYCDPSNADVVYIPGVYLQVSYDSGLNWTGGTFNSPNWVHADGHYMVFNSSNEIIFCTDGGLYNTTDGGTVWNDIENIPNNQFYFVTEIPYQHGVYAGGIQDNGTNYGNASLFNSYIQIYGGDGFTVTYPANQQLVYAEYQYGGIVYDDLFPSNNWQFVDKDTVEKYSWRTPYILSHFSDDTLYLGGETVQRIESAPYGFHTTISPVLHDPNSPERVCNISTLNQSPLNRNILYAGTADGKVWNTLNAGNSWNDITPFQGARFYVTRVMPSPNDINTVYVTRSGYRQNDNTPLVFKSVNNGAAWTSISGDLPALAVNDILIYPGNENIIFIANDAGVYMTVNGGVNWERVGDNMPFVAVLDISLNFNNNRIIAGTFGRSIYSVDITPLVTNLSTVELAGMFSVYPNPVSSRLNFNPAFFVARIEIYSSKGDMVLEGKSNSIDVSMLQTGNYFIKIYSGSNETIKRFIKL